MFNIFFKYLLILFVTNLCRYNATLVRSIFENHRKSCLKNHVDNINLIEDVRDKVFYNQNNAKIKILAYFMIFNKTLNRSSTYFCIDYQPERFCKIAAKRNKK